MDVFGLIKAAYFTFSGWLTAMLLYFLPIKELAIVIAIAFIVNFATGILVGILVQNEGIQFKKAFNAFCEVAVYLVIFTSMFSIGERMNSYGSVLLALQVITWSWVYFYFSNWSKNLKRLLPASRGIAFFYFVLNLEFLKRIPYLKKFEEYEKN